MKTFYTIALSGLSEADAKQVIRALESPKLGKWSLSEGGTSDLLIVDVDSVWGHMDWLRAVAENRHCAAYTDQESMRDCDLLLRKPLSADKLIEMLLQVQTSSSDTTATEPAARPAAQKPAPATAPPKPKAAEAAPPTRPKADATAAAATPAPAKPTAPPATNPQATPDLAAKPAPTASAPVQQPPASVGVALLGGDIDSPVMIESGNGDARLFIDPANNTYRAPPQLKPVEKLLEMPASKMRKVDNDDPQIQHAGPEQPIVRLLWFAALCASKGELAPHLDASATWKLTRWPQIEREFPRHFRIATAMMKQAGTLEDIAAAAKSPAGDVAEFINAYYVAGYVAADGSNEPVEGANSTANVLSRLRRSFSRDARQATT